MLPSERDGGWRRRSLHGRWQSVCTRAVVMPRLLATKMMMNQTWTKASQAWQWMRRNQSLRLLILMGGKWLNQKEVEVENE